jgi:ribulose-5-phosphate 4-epimerase/fuculose-1-phosphate aldolase
MAPSAITETASTAPTVTPKQMIKESENSRPKTALELISQGQSLPGIPTFPSYAEHRQWMLSKMALAFRVFARKGYTEGMSGHISVRDPENPHTFWTNPLSKHFGLLKASDMILVDYDGKAIGGNMSLPANAAGFLIHSAVHKARPDVTAACHTHSPYGKAWSSFAKPLEMLNQDVTYFYGDAQAVYEVNIDTSPTACPRKLTRTKSGTAMRRPEHGS